MVLEYTNPTVRLGTLTIRYGRYGQKTTRGNTRIPQDSHTLPQPSGMPYSRIPVVKRCPISYGVDAAEADCPVVQGGIAGRDSGRVPVVRHSSRVPVEHEDCAVRN